MSSNNFNNILSTHSTHLIKGSLVIVKTVSHHVIFGEPDTVVEYQRRVWVVFRDISLDLSYLLKSSSIAV